MFAAGGGKEEGRNISKSMSEHSLEIFCRPNDARRNYSPGSFSICSNLNGMISKACGSFSGRQCRKTKSLFLYTTFRGWGWGGRETKTRKTTLNFVHREIIKIGWQLHFDILVLRRCCFSRNGKK